MLRAGQPRAITLICQAYQVLPSCLLSPFFSIIIHQTHKHPHSQQTESTGLNKKMEKPENALTRRIFPGENAQGRSVRRYHSHFAPISDLPSLLLCFPSFVFIILTVFRIICTRLIGTCDTRSKTCHLSRWKWVG